MPVMRFTPQNVVAPINPVSLPLLVEEIRDDIDKRNPDMSQIFAGMDLNAPARQRLTLSTIDNLKRRTMRPIMLQQTAADRDDLQLAIPERPKMLDRFAWIGFAGDNPFQLEKAETRTETQSPTFADWTADVLQAPSIKADSLTLDRDDLPLPVGNSDPQGMEQLTLYTPPDYRSQVKRVIIQSDTNPRTDAVPDGISKVQSIEAEEKIRKDYHLGHRDIRQCYFSVRLDEKPIDGTPQTITIRSNLNAAFPITLTPPFKTQAGQVIDVGKTWKDRGTSELVECVSVDNQHFKINKKRETFFWYYEIADQAPTSLEADAERMQQDSEREADDEHRDWQLSNTYLLRNELDISEMDIHARDDLSLSEAWDYCSDAYEPIAGKVIEKHEVVSIKNDADDAEIADTRFFMTQLRLTEREARIIKDQVRRVIGHDAEDTKQWITRLRGEGSIAQEAGQKPRRINSREAYELIDELASGLEALEDSYQDDSEVFTHTDDMQQSIEELASMDDDEIGRMFETATETENNYDRRKWNTIRTDTMANWISDILKIEYRLVYNNCEPRDETMKEDLNQFIIDSKIATNPTRWAEANARQFTPATPDRLDARAHKASLTMTAAAEDYQDVDSHIDGESVGTSPSHGYHVVSDNSWITDRDAEDVTFSMKMNDYDEHELVSLEVAEDAIMKRASAPKKLAPTPTSPAVMDYDAWMAETGWDSFALYDEYIRTGIVRPPIPKGKGFDQWEREQRGDKKIGSAGCDFL